jgi:hypothetical protein
MEKHCLTQHGFEAAILKEKDTLGANSNQLRGSSFFSKNKNLKHATAERLIKAVNNALVCNNPSRGWPESQHIPIDNAENAVNYLLDNFQFLSKIEIMGLSGYICNSCITFQTRYIYQIGYDFTAYERHLCNSGIVSQFRVDRNVLPALNELKQKSVEGLISLCKSIFGQQINVYVESVNPSYFKSHSFHGPVIYLDSIEPDHWVWRPLLYRRLRLNEEELETIINDIVGTFTIIIINHGDYRGCHLLTITRENAPIQGRS